MRNFSAAEIASFVYGTADSSLAQAIRERAADDEGFAFGICDGSLELGQTAAA